jgi:LPXTG-site transpeptidase (sortase) family protein
MRKLKLRRIVGYTLIVVGLGLGILAVGLFLGNDMTSLQAPAATAGRSEAAPSADKPTPAEVKTYSVAADVPKYVSIPAIGLDTTRVKQLGTTKDNQIATPDNIYDAGWYNASAKPGQVGAVFMYGHVSSWQANGAFHDLKNLKAGDTVTITRGDNKQFVYKVVTSKIYSKDAVDMGAVLSSIAEGKPGLNLMTCTGAIIKGTSEFSERLVVFTKQV